MAAVNANVESGAAVRTAAPSISRQLADYWSTVRLEELPPELIRSAKRFILDTLAVGAAGANEPVVDTVVAGSKGAMGQGNSVLWGRSDRLPPAAAALVNGTAAHALELDDFGGCGHSGAVVVPAVCALASDGHFSGSRVLLAVIAGYDVASRVLAGAGGYRPHNGYGWHSTATCGSFGAAAACAKLLDLGSTGFMNALGIAGTFTGGLWAFLDDGAQVKRFHPGKASETGVSAALQAQSGLTGPERIFEAEWGGFYSTYALGYANPDMAVERLGLDFHIQRSGIKLFACCRTLHSAVEGMLDIMSEAPAGSSSIERIIVHGNAQTLRQLGRQSVETVLEAQFSAAYVLAVAATSGRASIDQFTPLRTQDPEVRRLMQRTRIEVDRELGPADYPSVEVIFANGSREYGDVLFAKGAPEAPVSEDDLIDKASGLLDPTFGERSTAKIIQRILTLDEVEDFDEVQSLLVRPN